MIKVVIADAYPIVRLGLAYAVKRESDMDAIVTCSTPEDLAASVVAYQPSVAVVDLRIKGSGIHAIRTIASEYPEIPTRFILYSDRTSHHHIARTIRCGGHGICLKGDPLKKVMETIRLVSSGLYAVSGRILSNEDLVDITKTSCRCDIYDTINEPLSDREAQVLRLVARGMSNKEIARSLGISGQTVKNHVSNIMAKMGARDRVQLALQAIGYGWVPVEVALA